MDEQWSAAAVTPVNTGGAIESASERELDERAHVSTAQFYLRSLLLILIALLVVLVAGYGVVVLLFTVFPCGC